MNDFPDYARNGELLFVPLGGAGEIGMNLSLYGYAGQWLMVDCGVSFGDQTSPGADIVVPDPTFIAERRDRLAGILITHAHEDHIGAVPYLWRRFRRPVYVTPFAGALLRRKLVEAGIEREVPVTEFPLGGAIEIGPFRIASIPVAHSIPEGQIIAIATKAGTVIHASDWKLDPAPLVGPVTDEAALRRFGDAGVLALVCDSTNVFVPGEAGSEAAVRESLTELLGRYEQRIAVTCFASNIARVESIAHAAMANGRSTALIGRSLWTVTSAARECGYLATTDAFVDEEAAGYLPRDKVVYVMTGSQGEPRSALARVAADDHPEVTLDPGDVVVFSSRVIPGNEVAIGKLQSRLARLGVGIVTERDHFVHVSGHPARDELAHLYRWVRPRLVVPVHGEARHLYEHARFARDCQVPAALIAENGTMVRLAPGAGEIVGHVPVGRLAVDGTRIVPADGELMRARRRMAFGGAAVVTLVLDRNGRLAADPQVALPGLVEGPDEAQSDAAQAAIDAASDAVEGLDKDRRKDDEAVSEAVRQAVRRALHASVGKRPMTRVHLVRV